MTFDEADSISTTRVARSMRGAFDGPARRCPPAHIDSPPDEFPVEDRDDPSLRLWFVDEKEETGRIGDDLGLEYDGQFGPEIETTIDDVAADTEDDLGPDPVDFNTLSVRLYADVGLRRLVHVAP